MGHWREEGAARVAGICDGPRRRGELIRFTNGFALINDAYNSSPAALQAMCSLLAATPGFQRRILAAGEIANWGRPLLNCIAKERICGADRKDRFCGWSAGRRFANRRRANAAEFPAITQNFSPP